jgi:hypothetical protein
MSLLKERLARYLRNNHSWIAKGELCDLAREATPPASILAADVESLLKRAFSKSSIGRAMPTAAQLKRSCPSSSYVAPLPTLQTMTMADEDNCRVCLPLGLREVQTGSLGWDSKKR